MKSSLKKLRNFALPKHTMKDEASADEPTGPIEESHEVQEGMQVVEEMQSQLDGLLSIGHMVSSAAYDFSRSFQDMASYMVETLTQIHISDGETGNVFDMLGKVQFEISKILDAYCAHVAQTIISPNESLMTELQHVKDMKSQYDEKRQSYNHLCTKRPKGKLKNGKGDPIDQKVLVAKEELEAYAMDLGFRLHSLKQGRPLSLVTQAVRFHAAQANLFRKGLNCLDAVEPAMEQLSERQSIDRKMSEQDVGEYGRDDDQEQFSKSLDETGSFDSSPVSSQATEMDTVADKSKVFRQKWDSNSKSGPITPSVFNWGDDSSKNPTSELGLEKPPTKLTTYVLPSPSSKNADNRSNLAGGGAGSHFGTHMNKPLDTSFQPTRVSTEFPYRRGGGRHSNSNDENDVSSSLFPRRELYSSPNLCSRISYSGPFLAKPSTGNPPSSNSGSAFSQTHQVDPLYKSGPLSRSSITPSPPKRSPTVSPPRMPAPQITELHKLPTPPHRSNTPPPPSQRVSVIAYSAPLGKKSPEIPCKQGIPLPPMSIHMARSLSIPSSAGAGVHSQRQQQQHHHLNQPNKINDSQIQPISEFEPVSPILKPMPLPPTTTTG